MGSGPARIATIAEKEEEGSTGEQGCELEWCVLVSLFLT